MAYEFRFNGQTISTDDVLKVINECKPGASGIAENQDGERCVVQIEDDHIKVTTFQHNRWIRVNEYYTDGTTCEMFEGRWEE